MDKQTYRNLSISREEFQTMVNDNFYRFNDDKRPPSSWWLSLRDLANMEFNKAYDKEEATPPAAGA